MNDMFNIGDYITIKKKYDYVDWYHTNPMCILDIIIDEDYDWVIYKVGHAFKTEYTKTDKSTRWKSSGDRIDSIYVELSSAHIREDKLERILNG